VIVTLSGPLTLACVFVATAFWGWELKRISLGALILALGLLVDDAIIAIEAMVVKREEGWGRAQAAAFARGSTPGPMLSRARWRRWRVSSRWASRPRIWQGRDAAGGAGAARPGAAPPLGCARN